MKRKNESGAVIPFVAIALVALISMLALGIDVAIQSSVHWEWHRSAESMALETLRHYLELDTADPASGRLNTAADRAKVLTGYNVNVGLGAAFFEKKVADVSQTNLTDTINNTNDGDASGDKNGVIIPGRWHFSDLPGAASDLCYTTAGDPSTFEPCFEEFTAGDFAGGTDPIVNAIRVRYNVARNSGLLNRFSAAVFQGQESSTVAVQATASLVPRHMVFLVDLSASIHGDTHPPLGFASTTLPMYEVDPDKTTNDCGDIVPPAYPNDFFPLEQAFWGNLLTGPRPVNAPPTAHYVEDYVGGCLTVPDITNGDGSFIVPDNTPSFYFDQVVAPEPLTSVLTGVNQALNLILDRSVVGDRVGIVGFDDSLVPIRMMELSAPDDTPGTEYAEFMDATIYDPGNHAATVNNKVEKMLFARTHNAQTLGVTYTDITLAIGEAQKQLSESTDFQNSENSIVLFTDGLQLCDSDLTPRCQNNHNYFQNGFSELKDIISNTPNLDLAYQRIALHVLLFGQQVGPHTLLVKDTGGCATDEQARENGWSFVDASSQAVGAFGAPGLTVADSAAWGDKKLVPFFRPNDLYYSVTDTKGVWAPIRTPCTTDYTSSIESLCEDSGGSNGDVVAGDDVTVPYGVVDASGRLLCDPEARPKRDQVTGYISSVLEKNPFVLVE